MVHILLKPGLVNFKHYFTSMWDDFMSNTRGKSRSSDRLYSLELQNHYRQWFQLWNKKMLVPWKESYDKSRQRIKKQRHQFAEKSPYSQSCDFSRNKEDWALKKWCFQICGAGGLLRVPWASRIPNQSVLKEIDPEYSLEGLMLKLKLQYFGYLIWRASSLEKTLMLGKIGDRRRRGQQRMR